MEILVTNLNLFVQKRSIHRKVNLLIYSTYFIDLFCRQTPDIKNSRVQDISVPNFRFYKSKDQHLSLLLVDPLAATTNTACCNFTYSGKLLAVVYLIMFTCCNVMSIRIKWYYKTII